jgi:predicted TIM-barrel fold metal-dependent hydrolase
LFGLALAGWAFSRVGPHRGLTSRQAASPARGAAVDTLVAHSNRRGARSSTSSQPVLETIQVTRRIIDVHEHIQSADLAPVYLQCMDDLGIARICLMGSSNFTLTLNEKYGFTGYDENNEELLKIVGRYPGRFEAWVTVNPLDPDKLEKTRRYVARGASGLKLYIGHGYITRAGEHLFHTVPIDDPDMLPLYAYCERNFVPVCIHVNLGKENFAREFASVLDRFPNLKVICPHFMLSSANIARLCEFLDTYPNLYTDVSFGSYYLKDGLVRISRKSRTFRELIDRYPDRFMLGADLVLTGEKRKTPRWVTDQLTAYLDMLTRERYITPFVPGETLDGLGLSGRNLRRVLGENYEEFMARRPVGTRIGRSVDWSRMKATSATKAAASQAPP